MKQFKDTAVLITGVAGFIGFHLTKRLLCDHPGLKVVGIDNMNAYYDVRLKEARLRELLDYGAFTFIRGDIADKDTVADTFDSYRPEIVVNLAAQAGVRHSVTDPDVYVESNIIGFYNILEAVRHSYYGAERGVTHLVSAGSSSVYGANQKVPYSTADPTDTPVSLYAATKKADELMAYAYSALYHIPFTGLRFFTVYGPNGRPDMAYFNFTRRLLNGEKIQLFNHGNCMRDFTYIDDVVNAICLVIGRPPRRAVGSDGLPTPPYALYNVGNSHPVPLLRFVDILRHELVHAGLLSADFNLDDHLELAPMQPGDVPVTYADVSALERDFGFRPSTPLQEGLRRFAGWYKEYFRQGMSVAEK